MRIVVLNGSPKGQQSVTMQYVRYIEKRFPRHRFTYIDISEKIQRLEKSEQAFNEVIDVVREADGVLWAFPLFYFLVPSQYKRFIELIRERGAGEAFRDKYTAVLTTSIHILDMIAHHYMNGICDDLHMKYTGSFSASMYDLLKKGQRKQLFLFFKYFLLSIRQKSPTPRNYSPVVDHARKYQPNLTKGHLAMRGKKILIVSDAKPEQANLNAMITRLQNSFFGGTELINLNDLDIKGGCLGCLQCSYDNVCVYEGKDGFVDFFNQKVRPADILVFVGAIQDRHLSSQWKCFFDRTFFNTHIPSMQGKQMGFLVSGPLGQLPDLRQFMEAYVEVQQGNLAGIISDDYEDSSEIDDFISLLADWLIRYSIQKFKKPKSYLEVGVRKILRDEIWESMRFPFQSDHQYFEKEGLYDFPERGFRDKVKTQFMVMITKIPFIRKEIYTKRMKSGTIEPLEKVVAETGPGKT
jgi:multimeric flavodoxin WrbA